MTSLSKIDPEKCTAHGIGLYCFSVYLYLPACIIGNRKEKRSVLIRLESCRGFFRQSHNNGRLHCLSPVGGSQFFMNQLILLVGADIDIGCHTAFLTVTELAGQGGQLILIKTA